MPIKFKKMTTAIMLSIAPIYGASSSSIEDFADAIRHVQSAPDLRELIPQHLIPSQQTTSRWWNMGRSIISSVSDIISRERTPEPVSPPHEADIPIELLSSNMDFLAKTEDSRQYLLQHHPVLTTEEIHELIEKGNYIWQQIIENKEYTDLVEIFSENGQRFKQGRFPDGILGGWGTSYWTTTEDQLYRRQANLETLACLIWALQYYCFEKGIGFTRGSFSLIDTPDNKFEKFWLYRILRIYDKGLHRQPDLEIMRARVSDIKSADTSVKLNNAVYQRPSSHHKNELQYHDIKQFGIDLRLEPYSYPLKLLPHGYTHLLWIILTKGDPAFTEMRRKIFIKFEPHGIGDWFSLGAHVGDFLRPVRLNHMMRREKDVHQSIAEKAKVLVESNTFIPEELYPISLVRVSKKFQAQKEKDVQFFTESRNIDISEMWGWCHHDWSGRPDLATFIDELRKSILECYPDEDMLPYRTGNEVLLRVDQLAGWKPIFRDEIAIS